MEILTDVQIKTLNKMALGKEYNAEDLYCGSRTLKAIVRAGFAEYTVPPRPINGDAPHYLRVKKIKSYGQKKSPRKDGENRGESFKSGSQIKAYHADLQNHS